jgi:hypothetical protein
MIQKPLIAFLQHIAIRVVWLPTTGDEQLAARLYCTLQTELWLRGAHAGAAPEVACSHPTVLARSETHAAASNRWGHAAEIPSERR